jgi:hypothetical protein
MIKKMMMMAVAAMALATGAQAHMGDTIQKVYDELGQPSKTIPMANADYQTEYWSYKNSFAVIQTFYRGTVVEVMFISNSPFSNDDVIHFNIHNLPQGLEWKKLDETMWTSTDEVYVLHKDTVDEHGRYHLTYVYVLLMKAEWTAEEAAKKS